MPAKRRFLDLTVDEISAVDFPANEEEFLITKRKQMPDEATASADTSKTTTPVEGTPETSSEVAKSDEAKAVVLDLPATGDAEVIKSINNLVTVLAEIAKAETSATTAEAPDSTPAPEQTSESNVEKGFPRKAFEKMLTESGLTDETKRKAALDSFHKAYKTAMSGDAAETKKSDLSSLETALKSLVTALEKSAPAPAAPPASAAPTAPSTEALTKALEPLTSKLQEIESRISGIEKSAKPSQSEADVETTPTEKSIWSGVL